MKRPDNTQSQSQMSAEETAQFNRVFGEQLVTITPIENSPFVHIKNKETKKQFLTFGNYIVLDNITLEESIEAVNSRSWELITNTMYASILIHKSDK